MARLKKGMPRVHTKDLDAQPGGVDDMTKLEYLHEPGVLFNLASMNTSLTGLHCRVYNATV